MDHLEVRPHGAFGNDSTSEIIHATLKASDMLSRASAGESKKNQDGGDNCVIKRPSLLQKPALVRPKVVFLRQSKIVLQWRA